MTAIELIQMVQDAISEETFDRFSKAEILRWLNRGLEDIAVKTGYLTWKWKITIVNNKREYPYPVEAKNIYRLEYDDKLLPPSNIPVMDEVTDKTEAKWLTATGPPENWYHSWNRAIGIYPTPDNTYAIYLYGFSKAAVLSDDENVPLIPDQFHLAPAYFAAFQIKREDGDIITSASLKKDYFALLTDMIKEKRKMEKIGSPITIKLAKWSA